MITAENLSWQAQGKPIIEAVNASFAAGKLTAILGPNGSGKTTLLHLLAGLRTPSTGRVLLAGEPLAKLSAKQRARRIAVVEQHPSTELELTARQVVALGRIPYLGAWPGAKDREPESVEQAMEIAGVAQLAERSWATMSGGERQRIHLARALAQRPQVLLLDEPTNHLDLAHQLGFLEVLTGLDSCIVAVLHDLDLAAAFCDQVLVMHQGRVFAAGPTQQVLTPELIQTVYGVKARVENTDRLRVNWSRD